MQKGIALLGAHTQTNRETFMNERELLYKVLFDMKREMTEMRQQLNGLLTSPATPTHRNSEVMVAQRDEDQQVEYIPDEDTTLIEAPVPEETVVEDVSIEDSAMTTMEDIERESIRRALQRNKGSRKMAAAELHISERTLYRKIKEYDL